MLHSSQLGINCLAETPEGPNLGLLKNLSLLTVISKDIDSRPGLEIVFADQRMAGKLSNEYQEDWIPVMLFGVVYCWTAPASEDGPRDILGRPLTSLEQVLYHYRRSGELPYDSCIFYNTVDNIIEYYSDASRPCRPLLIVNPDGQLAIDQLGLWGKSPEELIKAGAVEFVDAREQEYIMLAMSTKEVRDRLNRKNHLQEITGDFIGTVIARRLIQTLKEAITKKDQQVIEEVIAQIDQIDGLDKFNGDPTMYDQLIQPSFDQSSIGEIIQLLKQNRDNVVTEMGLRLFKYFRGVELLLKVDFDVAKMIQILNFSIKSYFEVGIITSVRMILENQEFKPELVLAAASGAATKFVIDNIDNHWRKYEEVRKVPVIEEPDLVTKDIKIEVNIQELIIPNIVRVKEELVDEYQEILVRIPDTHSEIDPIAIFGIAGGLAPQGNCSQGPRTTYQASMCKQALGFYHYNHHLKFDTSFKIMLNPSRPIFETIVAGPASLNSAPTGFTPIGVFFAMTDGNEDAMVIKKEFLDCNSLDVVKYSTHKSIIKSANKESTEKVNK